MKFFNIFLGRRDFWPKSEIISFIGKSKHFEPQNEDQNEADAILIFQTPRQQTWIISTNLRLYCILDDIRKNIPHMNWSIHKIKVVKKGKVILEIREHDNSERTGLVDFGRKHINWLFTKCLFENWSIKDTIYDLITRKMIQQ